MLDVVPSIPVKVIAHGNFEILDKPDMPAPIKSLARVFAVYCLFALPGWRMTPAAALVPTSIGRSGADHEGPASHRSRDRSMTPSPPLRVKLPCRPGIPIPITPPTWSTSPFTA